MTNLELAEFIQGVLKAVEPYGFAIHSYEVVDERIHVTVIKEGEEWRLESESLKERKW